MSDSHPHGPMKKAATRRLWISVGLTSCILLLELIGGLLANSLSLLSDAGHVFTDLAASALILLSIRWATKPATSKNTYGYYRVEILATLVNGALLLFIALQILLEAYRRLFEAAPVRLEVMIPVAAAGLVANVISVVLLHHDRDHLATRSAYYHVLSDTISSVGVVLAGLVIFWTGWTVVDPITALAIAGMILFGGYRLLREAVSILMEASPSDAPLDEVEGVIRGVPGVEGVHDLHVWTISSGYLSASAHIQVRPMDVAAGEIVVGEVATRLRERFGISHTTFQLESYRDSSSGRSLTTEAKPAKSSPAR